jgi:hypothetical protein
MYGAPPSVCFDRIEIASATRGTAYFGLRHSGR